MQLSDLIDLQAWRSPRNKRFWLLAIALAYTLAGFFLVPWLLKANVGELSQRFIMRTADVQDVRFNPFTLRLQIDGFTLADTDKSELAGFEQLVVNFELRSALKLALVFSEISLRSPHINLIRYAFADSNVGRMLADIEASSPADPQAESQDSGLPRLIVDNLGLSDGTLTFRDELSQSAFETRLGPIDINIRDLSTLPDASGMQKLSVTTETGATLKWEGDLQLSPLKSAGKIEISGSPLPLVYRYLKDQLRFRVQDCCLDITLDYSVQAAPAGDVVASVDNLTVSSRELDIRTLEGDKKILRVPEIRISNGRVEWPARAVSIGEILIDKPELAIWLQPDGMLNLEYLAPAGANSAPEPGGSAGTPATAADPSTAGSASDSASPDAPVTEPPPGSSAPQTAAVNEPEWDVSVAALRIAGMRVDFEDLSLAQPGTLSVPSLDLTVSEISNRAESRWPFSLSAQIGERGSLTMQGSSIVLPAIALETELKIADIAIADLQPWVSPIAQIAISDGRFGFSGTLASNADEVLAVEGDLGIANLAVSDTREKVPLIGWDQLALEQTRLRLTGGRLDISQISLQKPFVRLIIAADGTTNYQSLANSEAAEQPPAAASTGQPAPEAAQTANGASAEQGTADDQAFAVSVARTVITNGAMEFGDYSLPLPFQVPIREFGGSLSAFATDSAAATDVALEGTVGEYGYVKVGGGLNAMAPTQLADINVTFRNIDMPKVSPYTAKFAGRKIASGKLDLDLNYRFDNGIVQGENKVVLEKFQLGEKVENPDALDLPLDLAVSLLTDSNGVIDLQLDVSGNLEDPDFSVGSVLLQVFANLITKAVTAPFKLLAGLLPGSPDIELDKLIFAPGRADLLAPEKEKLDQLAIALGQRPQLVLAVPGEYNRALDTGALQATAVETLLAERLGDDSGADKEDVLIARTRKALERLAGEQLPDLDINAMREQFQRPATDSQRATLDEVAYSAELRRRLEAVQQIADPQLVAVAADRQSAVILHMTENGVLDAARVIPGEIKATTETDGDSVKVSLEIETGSAIAKADAPAGESR